MVVDLEGSSIRAFRVDMHVKGDKKATVTIEEIGSFILSKPIVNVNEQSQSKVWKKLTPRSSG